MEKNTSEFCFFRKTSYFCLVKELFDSIATQNAEIRTVANSLPPLLKYFAKSLFLNQLSLTDKNLNCGKSFETSCLFIKLPGHVDILVLDVKETALILLNQGYSLDFLIS